MSEYTESEIVERLAKASAEPVRAEPGRHYVWRNADGSLRELDLSTAMPARRAGTVTVRDVASFAAYFAKHADEASEVYGDLDGETVTAVLDAHRGSDHDDGDFDASARWQSHRLVLGLQATQAWETWLEFDRKMRPQAEFAEFLEDNYRDLSPHGEVKAADLLEIAQSFTASTRTEFVSGQRLSSGDIELTISEVTNAAAGKQRKISIPQEFDLAIAPYEDCGHALISARFRYRAQNGALFLGYFLNQPERHRENAVREIVGHVSEATGRDVWLGTAP